MSLCEGFTVRRVMIKPKKANEAHKILGMEIAPDGNQRAQVKTMVKKVKEWRRNMEMWKVPPRLRDLSYRMNLWPALKYPLGVCQLSLADVEAVERELRPTLKAANYLSSRFSNTIMSLPLKFGGYGGYDLRRYMVSEQAKYLLHVSRVNDNTGKKARNLLEFHQLECGREKSVLELEGKYLELLTNSWIKTLITELRRLELWVKTEHWRPVGGSTVMDMLWQRGEEQGWMEKINLCRLRNKVMWVDDLYRADGTLCTSFEDMSDSISELEWPKTSIPKAWESWWWRQIQDVFPQRIERVVWIYRTGAVMLTEDEQVVRVRCEVYSRLPDRGRRGI